MHQLLGNCKIVKLATPLSTGTSAVTGTSVDLTGWKGVVFFTTIPTKNTGNFLKAQSSTDDSSYNDIAGSKTIAVTDADVVCLDVSAPAHRYARPVLIRAGATTTSVEIYGLLYGSNLPPIAAGTNVIATTLTGAADGTA